VVTGAVGCGCALAASVHDGAAQGIGFRQARQMIAGMAGWWWLVALNAATSALLLIAGIGKLYSPTQLDRALREVLPLPADIALTAVAIRLLAALELATGVGLLVPGVRLWAAASTAVLGIGFVAFGTIGWVRHSHASCGCLARPDGRPLGPANVIVGATVAAIALANVSQTVPSSSERNFAELAALAATLDVLIFTVWMHRQTALILLRRVSPAAKAPATSLP
jgi:uncharacterized membrane protein